MALKLMSGCEIWYIDKTQDYPQICFSTLVYHFCSCGWNSKMTGSFPRSCVKNGNQTEWMHAIFLFPLCDVIFDLSTHPDCSEVWPPERRGTEAVDPGRHWSTHRLRLPERVEEWSPSVRVRTFAELCWAEMSHSFTVGPFWYFFSEHSSSFLYCCLLCWLDQENGSQQSMMMFIGLKSQYFCSFQPY